MMLATTLWHPLDLGIVAAMVLSFVAMGIYFYFRNEDTQMYFLGGNRLPSWAIGLSMVGTTVSSVTFLALPAAAFALDYRMIVPNLMLPIAAVMAVVVFIPIFRNVVKLSAFEYLEHRFGSFARLYGVLTFVLTEAIRAATVLFLVAIPTAYLTGASQSSIILICGIFVSIYTMFGGFSSVVWTDVVQTGILLLGGIFAVVCIVISLPNGLSDIFTVGNEYDKFSLGPTTFGFDERTLYVMMLMGLLHFTAAYTSSQNMVQRYLAAKSTREARKATIICALVSLPTWLMFFFVGTCLFVYYSTFPSSTVSAMDADEVFPYFILNVMPTGVTGVVVAGCFAAAMSSLDSALNAISTVLTNDVVKRHAIQGRGDQFYLRVGKILACLAGIVMTGGALSLQVIPRESMANLGFIMSSLFGGVMLGIFLLGFFCSRVDNRALVTGLVVTLIVNVYLASNEFGWLPESLLLNVHSFWCRIFLNIILVVVAYGTAVLIGGQRKVPEHLTVWKKSV